MSTRPLTTTSYAVLGAPRDPTLGDRTTSRSSCGARSTSSGRAPRATSMRSRSGSSRRGSPRSREEWNGDRKRTVYSITENGRDGAPARGSRARVRGASVSSPSRTSASSSRTTARRTTSSPTIARIAAGRRGGDRALRRARPRSTRGRRPLPRAHPRERLARHALGRAGTRRGRLGAVGPRRGRAVGLRRASPTSTWAVDAIRRARSHADATEAQRRALSARSIWRFASRSARSRRLSIRSLPRAIAISTLTRPSLK